MTRELELGERATNMVMAAAQLDSEGLIEMHGVWPDLRITEAGMDWMREHGVDVIGAHTDVVLRFLIAYTAELSART